MKKIIALLLFVMLFLVGCNASTENNVAKSTSDLATTESSAVVSTTSSKPTTTETTTIETSTTEQVSEANSLQVNIMPNDLTILARPNDEDYKNGFQIVAIDDLATPFINTDYTSVGIPNHDTGCALAITQEDGKQTFYLIDQAGKNVEPTHRYFRIESVNDDLYFGLAVDEKGYVFDYQGNVYGEVKSPTAPIYDSLTNALYFTGSSYDVDAAKAIYNIDNINKRINKIEGDLTAHYASKYRLLEEQFNISFHETDNSFSYSDGDNVKSIDSYKIIGDYAIVEHSEVDSNDKAIRRYGLIKRGAEKILDADYYAISHLYGDYFYVATNQIEELEDEFADYRNYDDRSFKKAIYRAGEQLTDQLYFNISHVVGDVFHVFDGEDYYFIAAESGQRVWQDVDLFANYNFYQVADCIVAVDDPLYTSVMAIIKDGRIIARYHQKFAVNGGFIRPRFYGYATYDYHLPVAELEDDEVAKEINDNYLKVLTPSSDKDYYEELTIETFYTIDHDKLVQISEQGFWHSFGAAHPNYAVMTTVFSAKTGKPYRLADWFKSDVDYQAVLAEIMLQNEANMERALYITEDMTREQKIKEFDFESVNYYFEGETLVIYYNPYAFASFADGIVEFNIQLRDIENDLTDEAKALLFN